MFRNYLKITFRNLVRHKGFSLINILGLAVGMAVCILIFLYILHETSYDTFHEDHDRIFRLAVDAKVSNEFFEAAASSGPMGPALLSDYPEEVENFTRIQKTPKDLLLSFDDKAFYEEGFYYADSTFFDMFSFRLLEGDPETVLDEPFSLVIDESLARKYFGEETAIGKTVKLNGNRTYKITGVVEDCKGQSHFQFRMLASFNTLYEISDREFYENWGALFLATYIKLKEGVDYRKFDEKFTGFIKNHMADRLEVNVVFMPYLQPVSSIHLHSDLIGEIGQNSDIAYIYIFSAVALLVLVIACINFMNLTTARSMKRAREVGLRKVVGADRGKLIRQFIGESVVLTFLGMLISVIIVELLVDPFSRFTGIDLSFSIFSTWYMLPMLLLLVLAVGTFAGSYPAFYLSSIKPSLVLKGGKSKISGNSSFRNVLVLVQFSISVILLISTGIIYLQMHYVDSKKLGFDKEHSLVIPLRSSALREKSEVIKAELLNLPEVKSVTQSSAVPGTNMDGNGYYPEGIDETNPWIINTIHISYDFVETLGLNLLEGRSHSKDFATDERAILINESLLKKLGWENVTGRKVYTEWGVDSTALKIIGVVEDFHFESLHTKVSPSIMMIDYPYAYNMIVRLEPGNVSKGIESLRSKWESIEKVYPFSYFFLDQEVEALYMSENRMITLFLFFTLIAIFIACLGLFGLASFVSEQRTKEIGIRKAIGASVDSLVYSLVKQFLKWVLIANLIAWPVAFFIMGKWLERFAYRIEISESWFVFIVATLISIGIAFVTVSYQSVRTAMSNPVKALRYE